MKKIKLAKFKKFAMNNFIDPVVWVGSDKYDVDVTNPWMDASGRFELDDDKAAEVWGSDLIHEFVDKVIEYLGYEDGEVEVIWDEAE